MSPGYRKRPRYRRRPGPPGGTCLRHPGRPARKPPGWRDESYRHSLAAHGVLSVPWMQEHLERYHGLHIDQAYREGSRFAQGGITDREEIEWEAGPMIREMAGYEDRHGQGTYWKIPRGIDKSVIEQREAEFWGEFWRGYDA